MTTEKYKDKIERLKRELAELPAGELADLLAAELDRRRLDDQGNPTEAPGLYNAAVTSMLALLGQRIDDRDKKLAERLAAVGRGMTLARVTADDERPYIRQIAALVEAVTSTKHYDATARAKMLAKTLSGWLGRRVDPHAVRAALKTRGTNEKVRAVGALVGLTSGIENIKKARRE